MTSRTALANVVIAAAVATVLAGCERAPSADALFPLDAGHRLT